MSADRRARIHPATAVVWALFVAALLLGSRLAPDEAAVRAALEALGPLAPLAFVAAEVIQVVVIPLPGQPLEIPGGYLFGLVPGTVLASVGSLAGSLIAFAIGRRYGRPWVEARVAPAVRARFEGWLGRGHRTEWIVFWLMLVPAFPRDPLCYLAGMVRLSPARFAVIAAISRPIGLAPWVALGAGGVELGLAVQLWMIAAAGVVWLAHVAYSRLRGPSPPDATPAEAPPSPSTGEHDA